MLARDETRMILTVLRTYVCYSYITMRDGVAAPATTLHDCAITVTPCYGNGFIILIQHLHVILLCP